MTEKTENTAKDERNAQQQPARPKKKICRRWLCILSAVIFLPVFALIGALSTETGTRTLVQWTDKLLDSLSVGEVSGSLRQGLVLKNVRFRSPGVAVDVGQTRLQLDFGCIWRAGLCVEELSVREPVIDIDSARLPAAEEKPQEPENNAPLRRIELPVSVTVKKVAVENLALTVDQHRMTLAQFQSAVSLDDKNGLVLAPTQLLDFTYVTVTTTDALKAQQKREEQTANTANEPVDWAQLEQTLTPPLLAGLEKIELPFDVHVQDIQGKNWQYQTIVDGQSTQHINVFDFQLQADAADYTAALRKFRIESSLGNLWGEGQIRLSGDFPLNFVFHADLHQFEKDKRLLLPASSADLTLSGSLKKQTALLLQTQGAAEAQLTARAELNREKTPLQLSLTGRHIAYPFVVQNRNNEEQLNVKEINLQVSGDLLAYRIGFNAQAEGMGAPQTKLEAAGSGGLSSVTIEKFRLHALNGSLDVQGRLDWRDGIAWQSAVGLNGINAGAYVKEWPAVLSGKLVSSGYANSRGWRVEVPVADIHGSLRQRPLALKADLRANQEKLLDISQFLFTYGENKISAQGHLGAQSDFGLDINAPDLRGLLPDLSAALTGKASLRGKVSEPDIRLELTGNRIRFQDLQLNKLYAKGNVNVTEQLGGRLDLELTGFNYGDVNVSRADFWLTGNERNHELHFRAKGEPVAAVFNLYGDFDRTSQNWRGVLNQIEIQSPIGSLTNDKNINVDYDNKRLQASISAHCWRNPDLELCFPQTFSAGASGEVPFALTRLNLALVNKLSGEDGLLNGRLRSEGSVAWFADKPLRLNVQVNGDNLALAKKIDYRTFKLAVPRLSLNGRLENNNLALVSEIQIRNQGRITTDLKLQDIAKTRKLGGSLNIQQLNLNLLGQLLSGGESISGDVNASLAFGGDLSAPLLNGSFNIGKIRAKMKSLPFSLNDGSVNLAFEGNRSTLQGRLQTPESSLSLDGEADWQSFERWHTRVRAQTDQFYADIPSMAKLKITSDVTAEATPELLDLSGEVAIPWARITVEGLPESAVSVSDDEVILDNKTSENPTALQRKMAEKTASGMAIKSDLKIRIGDDVTVNAYGLNSHLQGLLAVRQEKGNLGLYGQIELKHGRYASFGQDLLIRKGQIGFSGLPSQPILNIEAIRNPEAMEDSDVIAGIKVVGAADSPQVEVFSEPSMPQDQALSYILTGRSLENSGEAGSGGSIGAALLGLGLGKSGKLVGGIGEAFGIQDLNLGTAGVGDSSKVVVSGNITPRLQIKYGVGLFDGLAEVTLRYRLIPRLFLQSVSGVNQAFDILYQFDF